MDNNVCKKCGNNLYGNKTKCPFCGEPIKEQRSYSFNNYQKQQTNTNYDDSTQRSNSQSRGRKNVVVDSGSFGWGLLGFCFPIVGIVLYFVWKSERPFTSKVCLNGALLSIGIGIFFNIISACATAM